MLIIDIDELQSLYDEVKTLKESSSITPHTRRLVLGALAALKLQLNGHKTVGWFTGANPRIILDDALIDVLNDIKG